MARYEFSKSAKAQTPQLRVRQASNTTQHNTSVDIYYFKINFHFLPGYRD